jgi:hypothetical protein
MPRKRTNVSRSDQDFTIDNTDLSDLRPLPGFGDVTPESDTQRRLSTKDTKDTKKRAGVRRRRARENKR